MRDAGILSAPSRLLYGSNWNDLRFTWSAFIGKSLLAFASEIARNADAADQRPVFHADQ